MDPFRAYVFLLFACNVHAICNQIYDCHPCLEKNCVFYYGKGGGFCAENRVTRSAYTIKIRSQSNCPVIPSAPEITTIHTTTTTAETTTLPVTTPISPTTTTLLPFIEFEGPTQTSTSDNGTLILLEGAEGEKEPPERPLASSTSLLHETEKEIKREILRHHCKAFTAMKRIRLLKRWKQLTKTQIKRAVKQCLKMQTGI